MSKLRTSALEFTCNLCGATNVVEADRLGREVQNCACGSTTRFRAVVHLLSLGLFGESLSLAELPRRPELRGLGLTDWPGYADVLADRFSYTNTTLTGPHPLDITYVPTALHGIHDFVISSDVFEHTHPPVARAFEGAFRLLRPGGLLVLTVPYTPDGPSVEHYPELWRYTFCEVDGEVVLVNRTVDGRWQVFERPVFHVDALEMRVLGRDDVLAELDAAGFVDVVEHADDVPELGIVWGTEGNRPFTARKPGPA